MSWTDERSDEERQKDFVAETLLQSLVRQIRRRHDLRTARLLGQVDGVRMERLRVIHLLNDRRAELQGYSDTAELDALLEAVKRGDW